MLIYLVLQIRPIGFTCIGGVVGDVAVLTATGRVEQRQVLNRVAVFGT